MVFAVVYIAVAFGSAARAQSTSIGVTPAYPLPDNPRTSTIFIHTIKPGESATDGVLVINNTKETRTVNLGVVDSSASVDGSFSCKQNNEKQTKVGTWIILEKKSIELDPGTNEIVKFSIAVPKDAGPGEHGGCITAQDTKSYGATKGSGVLLGFRSAVRVAVTVPGTIVKKLSIIRIETKRLPDGNYSVSTVAKNEGNVSLDVQTRAQLTSIFDQQSSLKDEAKYPIMPGATMGWPYVFERPFWGGFYMARASISYNANPADGLGEHVGDVKKARAESGYFFMVPAPKALVVYGCVLLAPIAYLIWRRRRQSGHVRARRNWQTYTVKPGDTLTGLASARSVRWKKLARVNRLRAPYLLTTGQEILVPATMVKRDWDTPVPQSTSAKRSIAQGMEHVDDFAREEYRQDESFKPEARWQEPTRASNKVIYAPRPTNPSRRKGSATKSGGYSWANPGSAWAPRVVSEEELEQIIEKKAAEKKARSSDGQRSSKKQQAG